MMGMAGASEQLCCPCARADTHAVLASIRHLCQERINPGERYHTIMPEKTVYLCECGKKWVFEKAALKDNSTTQCKCGRTVIVHNGAVYSSARR